MDLSKLSKAQLEALVKQQAAKIAVQDSGLIVKTTDKGGVYIRHTSFVEFSTAKNKDYTAGINMGMNTAKALFGNPELLKTITEQVNGL